MYPLWSPYTNHRVEPLLRSFMRLSVNHNHNCNTITLNDHHEGPLNGPKIGNLTEPWIVPQLTMIGPPHGPTKKPKSTGGGHRNIPPRFLGSFPIGQGSGKGAWSASFRSLNGTVLVSSRGGFWGSWRVCFWAPEGYVLGSWRVCFWMNNSADYGRTTTTAIGFRSIFKPEKWRKTALGGPFGVPLRVPESLMPGSGKML